MTELFKRATWAQYINDSSGQYNDCKVLYITDKNIHKVRYNHGSKVSYIMYSESYGRCDFSYSQVLDIQDELSPGIYIFNDNVIYYYTGTKWIKLGSAGEGGGSSGDMGVTQISALNTSISIGGTTNAPTIAHGNTSDVVNLTNGLRTYVTSLTFDDYGHVTGYDTGTETVVDTKQTWTMTTQPDQYTYYLLSSIYSTGISPAPMATHTNFKITNNILYAPQFEGKVDGGEWS